MRRITFLLVPLLAAAAEAQSVGLGVAGVLDAPVGTLWSVGYSPRGVGPFDLSLGGLAYVGDGQARWGGSLELSLLRRAGGRWYATGGVQAGFGTGDAEATWTAWTAGVGFRLLRAGPVDLAVEGRYLHLSIPDDGVLLGVRLGIGTSRGRGSRERAGPPPPSPLAIPVARSPAAQAVIETALGAMGTPYAWGGSTTNGFDCSGLIQYAYQANGVALPRRSVDQAQAGAAVPRDPTRLLPGDILAFAIDGPRVSHVGMYVGDGRFIHSGSGGVQVSRLSPDDPTGGYWWRRWVGARRVLPEPTSP